MHQVGEDGRERGDIVGEIKMHQVGEEGEQT